MNKISGSTTVKYFSFFFSFFSIVIFLSFLFPVAHLVTSYFFDTLGREFESRQLGFSLTTKNKNENKNAQQVEND